MHPILDLRSSVLHVAADLCRLIAIAAARADVVLDPADASQGKRPDSVCTSAKWTRISLATMGVLLASGHSLAAEMVLRLGPGGAASLVNSSLDTSIKLTSYSITRGETGVELLPTGWDSFQTQGDLFSETSATVDLLSEAAFAGGLLFGPGQSRSIGVPFNLRADADGNGTIDLTDFAIWKSHQGQQLEGPGVGDFDTNGVVDLDDFEFLLNEMGNSAVYTFAAITAVPEPSGFFLSCCALAAILAVRWGIRLPSRVLQVAASIFSVAVLASAARADIFQWEYIDPADPSQGKQQSTTLAPDGAGVDAVPGSLLSFLNLSMAHLIGAELTSTSFYGATLMDADLTGAVVQFADFGVHPGSCSGYACFWPIGTGISLPQLYSTASYQLKNLSGVGLSSNNLINADFAGQNLVGANFYLAALDGADFSDAVIERADFTALTYNTVFQTGIRPSQLYVTASYKNKNLSGVGLSTNSLVGVNFEGQNLSSANFIAANLSNANFRHANLTNANLTSYNCGIEFCFPTDFATVTGADFAGADTRGMNLPIFFPATTGNVIGPEGRLFGLSLDAGELLIVRDYDGDEAHWWRAAIAPISITVEQYMTMGSSGTLRMVFEADAWDSTISFAPGIPITLGGTLELTFANDVNLASQVGRTFDLFDWTSVIPTGQFTVSPGPYTWNLSNLYTTGEVALSAVPEPTSFLLAAMAATFSFIHRPRK